MFVAQGSALGTRSKTKTPLPLGEGEGGVGAASLNGIRASTEFWLLNSPHVLASAYFRFERGDSLWDFAIRFHRVILSTCRSSGACHAHWGSVSTNMSPLRG